MSINMKKKRLGALSLVLFMLIGAFSVLLAHPGYAEEFEYSAYSKLAAEVDEETLYKKEEVIDDFKVNKWEGSEFVKSIGTTEYSGKTRCLLATADSDMRRTLGVNRKFEGGLSCDGYVEMMMAFIALGGTGFNYQLEIVLLSGENEHVYTVNLTPNEWHDVFLDITGIETVDSVSVTVRDIGTISRCTSIAISSFVMGDQSHGELARKFSAIDITGAQMTEDGITVSAENSKAVIRANAMLPYSLQTGKFSTVIMTFRVSGLEYSKITVATSPDPVWKTEEYTEKASVTVTAENDTYVCCFPVEGRIVSWEMSFAGILPEGDFVIEEIEISAGTEEVEGYALDTTLGTVTRCTFISTEERDTVQINGTLTRDAAVGYIDGEICLYMVPVWRKVSDVLAEEPLMILGTSTDFSFSIDLSSNQLARAGKFVVALRNSDGTVCIAPPIPPMPLTTTVNSHLPSSFVSDSDNTKVFASGADGTVIDIPLDKLIVSSTATNAKLTAWGDSYIYLDRTFLTFLEALTEFYSSCGIEIYFRLCVSQTDIFISAAGKNASGYALDVSTKQNADVLCAAVEYLSVNFSPDGYMIGYSLNSAVDYYSSDFEDIFSYMKGQSNVARCVYSIAASHNPQTILLLPFDAATEKELASTYGEVPAFHRASYCAALADYYTGTTQTPMRWAAVTSVTSKSAEDTAPTTSNISGSGFLGTAFALDDRNSKSDEPLNTEDIAELFPNSLSVFTTSSDAKFVENVEYSCEVNELPYEYEAHTGSLTMWDFSKSFMTYSWTLSDGSNPTTQISSALTDVMHFSSCRALHFNMNGTEDGNDIIAAAKFPFNSFNLSSCIGIELLMTAGSEDGEDASFTVMIGNSEVRYLFPVTVGSRTAVSVMCPLDSEIIPEYFAIAAGGDSPTVIDIASVSIKSDTLTNEQLEQLVTPTTPETDEALKEDDDMFALLLIMSVGLFSVMMFALLSRKKH